MPFKSKKDWNQLKDSFHLLGPTVNKKLTKVVSAQFLMALLDLLGVLLVGIVGALSAGKILGQVTNFGLDTVLRLFQLDSISLSSQVLILSSFALLVLTVRSITTIYLSKKTLSFLSIASARMSVGLFNSLTKQNSSFMKNRSSQEILLAITNGPQTIVLGIIFSFVSIITDIFMVLVMLILMIFVQPFTALATLVFFSLVGLLLHVLSNGKIRKYGSIETNSSLAVQESILETISVFEQLELRDKRDFLIKEIESQKMTGARATSELQFQTSISKYLLETTIVIGGFLVAGIQLLLSDVTGAVTALAIFVVSASRIAPSVMRIQQNIGVLRNY